MFIEHELAKEIIREKLKQAEDYRRAKSIR